MKRSTISPLPIEIWLEKEKSTQIKRKKKRKITFNNPTKKKFYEEEKR